MKTVTRKAPADRNPMPFALPRKSPAQVQRARRILKALQKHYPDARCALHFTNPHELLVATILSAQSTDTGVNKATPALFKAFPTPADYAAASLREIEPYVKTVNFYRGKAKSIQSAMQTIVRQFDGRVPDTMNDLLLLRGVARKTANVVLGNAYGVNEGVVVDTHVARVAKRFGLTRHSDPVKIERDLMALFPRDQWAHLAHKLIAHGRQICRARNALCATHPLCREFCSNARSAR